MISKTKLIVLLALVIFSFQACKDSEDPDPTSEDTSQSGNSGNSNNTKCRLLSSSYSYTSDSNNIVNEKITFTYDANKRVISGQATENNIVTSNLNYTYNPDGTISMVKASYKNEDDKDVDASISHTYNANKTIAEVVYTEISEGTTENETTTYHYNGDQVDYTVYSSPGESLITTHYIYSNGLIIESKRLDNDGDFSNTTYTYDDQNAQPHLLIYYSGPESLMPHNITKEVQVYGNTSTPDNNNTYTNTYTYEYNSHNFPTKRTSTFNGGSSNSISDDEFYVYQCD
jgi:hypothetical protein